VRQAHAALLALAALATLRAAPPEATYVGSRVCAACHMDIYQRYLRTAMGRSVTNIDPGAFPAPATVSSDAFHRLYRVFARDGALYQSEAGFDGAGRKIFESEGKVEYAVGSGENGVTFLTRRKGFLFEAPLSWYAKTDSWDLSPGYEQADEGFSRPAYAACMVCHAGRSRPVEEGADGQYLDPPFAEAAVGCENCHGPGSLHVAARQRGRASLPDRTIVNPSRLAPRLADNICMLCHQGGGVRVLLPGRHYADVRPGVPLIRIVALARLVSDRGGVLLEHHAAMESSRCFRATFGRLRCITCHNPHVQPTAAEAAAYYRTRCLSCHKETSCKLTLTAGRRAENGDNCVACHMPQQPTGRISHSALTDHTIRARSDEPAGSPSLRPAPAGLAGVELLNSIPGEPELPLITRLELCGELMPSSPELQTAYLDLLAQAARALPNDPLVLAALGRKALATGQGDAIALLERAVRPPAVPRQATYLDLADAYLRAGRTADVVTVLERAVSAFPYSKLVRKRLILSYIQIKDYSKARAALVAYVDDFPEDDFMRGLLKKANGG
jgi:hypothetical protein